MTPEEILEYLKMTDTFLNRAKGSETTPEMAERLLTVVHRLLVSVTALTAHVAAQQSDGK